MKTQRLANIWKVALAPFAPSKYAPVNLTSGHGFSPYNKSEVFIKTEHDFIYLFISPTQI